MDNAFPFILVAVFVIIAATAVVLVSKLGRPGPSSQLRIGAIASASALILTVWGVGGTLSPKPDFLVAPYLLLLLVGVVGLLFGLGTCFVGLVRMWLHRRDSAGAE